jgi:general secretion pathway protein G
MFTASRRARRWMERNIRTGSEAVRVVKMRIENSKLVMRRRRGRRAGDFGFTLLELMVVMAIIVILMTIATSRYEATITSAHEAKLKTDLAVLRKGIQDYTLDKECGPSTLDDLVTEKYVSQIPADPMTRAKDWVTVEDDISLSPEQSCNGISDIHSASEGMSPLTNTAYSSW